MRVRTRGLALQLVILCSLLLTLLSGALGPRPGTPPPAAQAATGAGGTTPFVYESFANSTPDNTGWVLGGTAQLTSGTTDGTTGTTDPSGAGWLRFTSETAATSLGYAYYNVPFTLTNGLIVSFDYTCWGGGTYGPYKNNGNYGADGTSFYLFDGSAAFSPGSYGGSLGYKGMGNAYVGIGLDEFGNFSGGYFQEEHLTIRGSGNDPSAATGYAKLTMTAAGAISPNMCNLTGAQRPSSPGNGYQHYIIAITPDLHVTVAAYVPGTSQVYIDRYALQGAAGQAALPATLKFGFAGATGAATDAHEIRNVAVSGIGPGTTEIMCGCNWSENLRTGTRQYTPSPVTLPTGDFFHTFTDFSIAGRGLPLQFTRTYNALLAGQNGPLGYGWSSDRTAFLTTDATGAITVNQEDGSTLPFSLTAPGVYQAPGRVLATLVTNGNGTLTLTRQDQQTLTFSAPTTTTPGLLTALADRNGYTTSLTYTTPLTTPLLSRITDAAGRSLTFTNDGHTHITGISDPINRTVAFTYDNTTGDLLAARDVGGHVTQFSYYSGHLLQTMTDPNGGTVTNWYDSQGRVITQTDPLSRTTTFAYADHGGGEQAITVTDPRGHVTVDTYQGNLLAAETRGSGTPQAATWHYTYDPATLGLTGETDPNGHVWQQTWDAHGNLLSRTEPATSTTAPARTTSYAYDTLDDVTAITDALSVTTQMTYDAHGNLLSVSTPLTPASPSSTAGLALPSAGAISSTIGSGSPGYSGDGGAATAAALNNLYGVAVDSAGDLFLADTSNHRIREVVAATGVITTVAGTGTAGFSGDGGAARSAQLTKPKDVAVDGSGNLYIADAGNNRIRKVTASTGVISTVAGTGSAGYSGDGGAATAAKLNDPEGVAVDSSGNLFIADSANNRIRKVSASTGVISTVAGTGTAGYSGDGGAATAAQLQSPTRVVLDGAATLYIADTLNNRVRKVPAGTGIISTVAGTGTGGFSGDGGAATSAQLDYVRAVGLDGAGNLFVADAGNNRVREVLAGTGVITTVAGSGVAAFGGDGGAASAARLNSPTGVAVDSSGTLFVADEFNNRVRKVSAGSGLISTVAGTASPGDGGDTGLAPAARLNTLAGVARDAAGNLFVADTYNNRVREVIASTGVITTVAGTGAAGFSGDGGAATRAQLSAPKDVAVDGSGDLFVVDAFNNRVREVVASTGVITTVAGTGTAGYSGDGGAPRAARLNSPAGVAVDQSGNLYMADTGNNRIREVVAATGLITTVAGTGTAGFGGDGGPAPRRRSTAPTGWPWTAPGTYSWPIAATTGCGRSRPARGSSAPWRARAPPASAATGARPRRRS